jgi:uncharacterized membrane protein
MSGVSMTSVWIMIAALAVLTALIKVAGPLLLGGRPMPARVTAVIALLAPALLASLVVVETFSDEDRNLTIDERVIGVAAAGLVMAWRRNLILTVIVAATVTALARAFV